ncbi:peptide transporter family 1-like [Diachasmimorpha longicaudata]|uniref:peptide transporter family 1-like n=1 Tax=Diachasmimorpha longicaudata TaxID=58733 RepID=UPI0030B8A986
MSLKAESPEVKKKAEYPKVIFIIIMNQFCEKFAYYGMRAILALYIRNKLGFSDDTSTIIFHTFTMTVFTFPLFGALVADSILGKFRTIFYFSIIYAVGHLLLSVSAVPPSGLLTRVFSMTGLFFMALGAGGMKPCTAALGGDQFVLPEQQTYLATFFSIFYFSINAGFLVSSCLTPELRSSIECFGDQDCYFVAFFVPMVFMLIGTVVFVMAKRLYRTKKQERTVILSVIKCISHAIRKKINSPATMKHEHWLDYAGDEYDSSLISDIKETLRVLKIFIPLPLFWALNDQQSSRWTFQASRMDGQIGNFQLKSDHMQVINPLLIIIIIPIFELSFYPLLAKFKCLDTQLKKLTIGGMMAAVAFLFSSLVELKLETTYPVLPTNGLAQVRIFNPRDCHLPVVINNKSLVMEPFGLWGDNSIVVKGNQSIPYIADFSQCGGENKSEGSITIFEAQATSYILESSTPYAYRDYVNKTNSGNPAIRVLSYNVHSSNATTTVELSGVNSVFETNRTTMDTSQITPVSVLKPQTYQVRVNGQFVDSIDLKLGGVYTLQTYVTDNDTRIVLTTVTPPNSVHIVWLLPQYIVITIAEVMFAVAGLQFAFSEAPSTMKSILVAAWLLTSAVGSLIVVIITGAKIFERQAFEFLLFAGLMCAGMLMLAIMAKSYQYKNFSNEPQTIVSKDPNVPTEEACSHEETIPASDTVEFIARKYELDPSE